MNGAGVSLEIAGAALTLLPGRALWWAAERLLVASDLHLGKSERIARRGGALVPPYESADTLGRLAALVRAHAPAHVVCLGDSFDDLRAAEALGPADRDELAGLMAGRRWTWVQGNHDPGPTALGGTCAPELRLGGIALRHAAEPGEAGPEISGHYHPKAGPHGVRRPAFVTDGRRLILPAFGTYTGGLDAADPAIARLMGPGARAILTGPTQAALPLSACRRTAGGPPRRAVRGAARGPA
ncbi:ligase-associated DNA damage response endonuclease PdeM [Rhodovulum sp. 12E13]|uniref:ligase-associated DNA damage response endonuclease PdeM n=1 Tax=Rhodovulum sp. 12E13 TaxID=2203891 RepID=UPI000E17AE9B|nr:ligase-associated DNA damage response endonuclease PdeM [Rhodovulum sp. 12E13]RDC73481.1 ligase-associated DNA damage response endonuclease PdeM [Rhodovulum sp. 12E13]